VPNQQKLWNSKLSQLNLFYRISLKVGREDKDRQNLVYNNRKAIGSVPNMA